MELAPTSRQAGGARDRGGGGLLPERKKDPQKNTLKPHLKKQWSIPPQQNAEFVWRMEDVLEVYTRPYDPSRPQVCMDETSKQMLRDARVALSMAPGRTRGEDYDYERGGVAHVFMFMEPLTGRRWVDIKPSSARRLTGRTGSRNWWTSVTHRPSGSCW